MKFRERTRRTIGFACPVNTDDIGAQLEIKVLRTWDGLYSDVLEFRLKSLISNRLFMNSLSVLLKPQSQTIALLTPSFPWDIVLPTGLARFAKRCLRRIALVVRTHRHSFRPHSHES